MNAEQIFFHALHQLCGCGLLQLCASQLHASVNVMHFMPTLSCFFTELKHTCIEVLRKTEPELPVRPLPAPLDSMLMLQRPIP